MWGMASAAGMQHYYSVSPQAQAAQPAPEGMMRD
jgi:hypothetical protein